MQVVLNFIPIFWIFRVLNVSLFVCVLFLFFLRTVVTKLVKLVHGPTWSNKY